MKTSWEHSENAVRAHLWVAIISSLIVAKIKADNKSPYPITEVATSIVIASVLIGESAFSVSCTKRAKSIDR